MNLAKKNFDLILVALIIAGYLILAAQRLGENPLPHTDESYMLQVSYEMINNGKLAQPFNRYLGGNIENTLHSFTPVHFLIQSGFLKLFGWGILQGRIFNLLAAAVALLLTYLIGRKLFDWRVGLIALGLILSDIAFFYRSRLLRNDYSAAAFALAAYYLYEEAERRKDWRWFAGSGLAAGAAFMSHTTAVYMIAAISILMLLGRGWRIIKDKNFYQFALSAFAVSAYEVIYDAIDYQNVLLQNRGDRIHFKILSAIGWLKNLRREGRRYLAWHRGGDMQAGVSRALLHIFLWLSIAAFVYLIARAVWSYRRGKGANEPRILRDPRTRILIVAATAAGFLAVIASQKSIYYIAHLSPLFAIMSAVMLADAFDLQKRLLSAERKGRRLPRFASKAAVAVTAILLLGYGYGLLKQTRRYVAEIRNPDIASFDEFRTAIRSLVPEGVCPVVVREPVIWLAFPEHDFCFSNLQTRMRNIVDLDGKEYALIVSPRHAQGWLKKVAPNNHHLLGELLNTGYGNYEVYYTGVNPRWSSLKPVYYQFFGKRSGYATDEQVAQATEIWSVTATDNDRIAGAGEPMNEQGRARIDMETGAGRRDGFVPLHSIELRPETIYQMNVEASGAQGQWAMTVIDEKSETAIYKMKIGEQTEQTGVERLFKTGSGARVVVGAIPAVKAPTDTVLVSRISLKEVAQARRAQ
jgi:4-amino-4-deoxy-L-arabinose transferase-like glycosyltransferase